MVFNSLKKFDIYNETSICLTKELKYMKKVLNRAIKEENAKNVYFTIIIVDNDTIHNINKTYRNIDRATDVISFALEDEKNEKSYTKKRMIGDIYISIDKALEQANSYGHSLVRELCFLSVHGFLHLMGYDHMEKDDEKLMFSKQDLILDKENIIR